MATQPLFENETIKGGKTMITKETLLDICGIVLCGFLDVLCYCMII